MCLALTGHNISHYEEQVQGLMEHSNTDDSYDAQFVFPTEAEFLENNLNNAFVNSLFNM